MPTICQSITTNIFGTGTAYYLPVASSSIISSCADPLKFAAIVLVGVLIFAATFALGFWAIYHYRKIKTLPGQ